MPSALPTILRRIQDQEDAPSLGAGQNGQALVWNNATGLFETSAISGLSINDSTTSLSSVWSSSKTDTEISAVDSDLTTHTADLTLHRVINDSSTATTVLWSGSKINTELASKGVGDFLADGSVAMTGDFNLAGEEIASTNGDTTHLLGRGSFGAATGGSSNHLYVSHRDVNDGASYALRQDSVGNTYINAASGRSLQLRVANASVASLSADSIDLHDSEITSDDGDTTHLLGRVAIGYATSSSTDSAYFGHRDQFNNTSYALRQTSTGQTIVNAASGQVIQFRVNGTAIINFESSGINFTNLPISSSDADTTYLLGRAGVGYDGTNSDRSIFSHRDHATSTAASFAQEADGDTIVNAPTSKTIRFRINGSNMGVFNSSGDFGVGETSPQAKIHATDSGLAGALYTGDIQIIAENNGNAGIQISSGATSFGSVVFGDSGDSDAGRIDYEHDGDRMVFHTAGLSRLGIQGYIVYPTTDDNVDLGFASGRFDDVYATNGTINTSDRNQKKEIEASNLGLAFINSLKPVSYKWRKAGSKRTHYGLIAQDVAEVLDSPDDFAGYIKAKGKNDEDVFGLRYTEFLAPAIKAIQELSARVEKLEAA